MKSSGVRATLMPSAPTIIVMSVTTMIAASASGATVKAFSTRSREVSLGAFGEPDVGDRDDDQHRIHRDTEHGERQRQAEHVLVGERGHQADDERQRDQYADRERDESQREPELRTHQRVQQNVAVLGALVKCLRLGVASRHDDARRAHGRAHRRERVASVRSPGGRRSLAVGRRAAPAAAGASSSAACRRLTARSWPATRTTAAPAAPVRISTTYRKRDEVAAVDANKPVICPALFE